MTDEPSSLEMGRVLGGRYRLVRLLGEGGMGAVYEAVHEGLGSRVAVKVLHRSRLGSANALARFRAEAESAARAGSPHIVLVTDFQSNPGEPPFLVMELLTGKSLRQLLEDEGVLSWSRAAALGSQLLAALVAAHAAGVVHRDIKPDNVFVTRSPAVGELVKVVDFGVAKLLDEAPITDEGSVLGTPEYMAPEQLDGAPPDERSDLYAVGVCLYEATTGRLPIEPTDSRMRSDDLRRRAPEPLDQVCPDADPRFTAVVMRALAKAPAARFQTAAEMAAALAPLTGVRDEAPAKTLPQGRTETPTRDDDASASHSPAAAATKPNAHTLAVGSEIAPARKPIAPSSLHPPFVPPAPPRAAQQLGAIANAAPAAPHAPATPRRTRGWVWALVAGLAALSLPGVAVVGFLAWFFHLTSVCRDARRPADERIGACETACSPDEENRGYCTTAGQLLERKADLPAARAQFEAACDAGDPGGCVGVARLARDGGR